MEKNTFLFHYCFYDDVSSMDALVHNYCERELLSIISTITKELNVHTKVVVEAKRQGSIIDHYNFVYIEGVSSVINIISTIVQLFLKIKQLKQDKLKQELEIKDLRPRIEKLEEEKNINISYEVIEHLIIENIKLKKLKSNLYKKLKSNPQIKKIETNINSENKDISKVIINREDFDDFIVEDDRVDPIVDENAKIEIISPVLKKDKYKYKWRGLYLANGQNIEFSMQDKEFRDDVIKKEIPFKTGTFINCTLIIERKIDDNGETYNSNYKVKNVDKYYNGDSIIETTGGKKRHIKKEAENAQLELFD